MKAKKVGRPKIGQPISITLTKKQRDWLEAQREDGEPLTRVVRKLISECMDRKG